MKEIAELAREVARRETHPIYSYNRGKRIHEKQVAFHKDKTRSRWVFGGNRTGKTECGAVETIWYALGAHPYREVTGATEGWVVSLSTQVQRDVAQAKILKYLPKEFIHEIVMISGRRESPKSGVIDFISVRNRFGTLSRIGFKSCDQGREKFQGTGLDFVWFDEEPSEDVYEECLLRTLDKDGVIWGTMTPLSGRNWLYGRIYLRAAEEDISIHEMSWNDNPFLTKKAIEAMERELSKDALESRKYGRFMEGSGLVFTEFNDENIIEPYDLAGASAVVGIDPGYVAPTAAVFVVKDGENYIVVDDYSVAGIRIPEHAEVIKAKIVRHGISEYKAVIDSASSAKNLASEKTVAQLFKDSGIEVEQCAPKNVFGDVFTIKSLFADATGTRRLFIFKNCVHLIKELRSYYWGDDERPVKKNDHCIDALRYAITAMEREIKPRASPLLDKKRELIRRNNEQRY